MTQLVRQILKHLVIRLASVTAEATVTQTDTGGDRQGGGGQHREIKARR